MRQFVIAVTLLALAGCHWFGQPPSISPERETLPARTETTDEIFAAPGETGGLCGGIAAIACKSDTDYCRKYPGDCTSVADSAGICSPKPEMCTMQYDPVCGCDGKTYGNACTAAAKGVSISRRGPCR